MVRIGAAALALLMFSVPVAAQHDMPAAPASTLAPASREARAADLAFFRENFMAVDKSFAPAARRAAEARLAALERGIGSVSQAYFELELSRIAALADNGHSNAFPGGRSRRYNRVPLRFVPFGERFYVLRADRAHADLLGAELVAVDRVPFARLRATARSLIGGTPAWRDRNAGYFFESPEQMHALGLLAARDRATYTLRLADGAIVRRALVPEPANPDRVRANADRWLYPEPAAGEGANWRTLLPSERAPWALREQSQPFRMRDAPEIDAYVIEMRQMFGNAQADLAGFMTRAEAAVRASGRSHLVLDLRQNGGGDLTQTRAFMRRLPSLVRGRIFALTSPWTFSAAISSLGYLKQAAPERVTIVGEEVGDRLTFFAEGGPITLPHSGVLVLPSRERHDYRGGCRGFTDCHGPVVREPIAVPTLAPDIRAPWTVAAYRAGRDPAMEAVTAAIRRRRSR